MRTSLPLFLSVFLCIICANARTDASSIGCVRFRLDLRSDGTVGSVSYTKGAEQTTAARRGKAPQLFTLELQESLYGMKEGKRRKVPLNVLSLRGGKLVLGNAKERDVRVVFVAADRQDYLTLRLVQVETPRGEHATSLAFRGVTGLRTFSLNAEVVVGGGDGPAVFQGLLRRGPLTKLGGIALWHPETEELDDEILYRVWVDEGLPHPKVKGEWTVERAKQWVADYIEKLRNYSEIYVTGDSFDELKSCVDYAARMKMANIYMHLMTWAGRYHTEARDVYDLNPKLFPNGHADFRRLCDYAKSKGVGVGIRTLSNSISLKSEQYIGKKPDRRLAHFWRGSLVRRIGPDDDSLTIESDRTLPTSFTPKAQPTIRFVLIDDEILQYDGYEEHADGSITLQVARERGKGGKGGKPVRGYGPTEAASHLPGAPVKILNGHFKDHVAPDHDSELLEVVARRYAEFSNKMELATSSFDGLYLYTFHTPYGNTKLTGAAYSYLDHPTWGSTSGGPPQWGFFEIRFNSVRRALGLKNDLLTRPMKIPGRMRLMIGLHKDQWPAPSPYGHTYSIVPHAVAGNVWCSIQDQTSRHEFTVDTFEKFGLLDNFAAAIQRWRKYGPRLPDTVKKRIWSSYSGSGRYPFQVEHFRLEEDGEGLQVVPFRPMRREALDRGWGFIQEHGPVYTYQYIRPDTAGLLQAENPYHSQVPEIIIRVMKDFDRAVLAPHLARADASPGFKQDLHARLGKSALPGLAGKDSGKPSNPGNQHRLMIPLSAGKAKRPPYTPGKMSVKPEPGGVRIRYDNSAGKRMALDLDEKGQLVTYRSRSSIRNAKGLAMVIHGDGSGAMFVVQIAGKREYGVRIDFQGKRYVEIPDPQVCWSDARIPLTNRWKRWHGHNVSSVAVGFSSVPARTDASVLVEDISLLPERDSALVNPVVHCGSGTIEIAGVIPSDRYLWYKGGAKAQVYDLNWNRVEELPVAVAGAEVPTGRSDVRVVNSNPDGDPWLEVQFFVRDRPIHTVRTE